MNGNLSNVKIQKNIPRIFKMPLEKSLDPIVWLIHRVTLWLAKLPPCPVGKKQIFFTGLEKCREKKHWNFFRWGLLFWK